MPRLNEVALLIHAVRITILQAFNFTHKAEKVQRFFAPVHQWAVIDVKALLQIRISKTHHATLRAGPDQAAYTGKQSKSHRAGQCGGAILVPASTTPSKGNE
jgi:hypothetical protein